jgi:hypothetical protein
LSEQSVAAGVGEVARPRLERRRQPEKEELTPMITKKLLLCEPPDTCCPSVEFHDDGKVVMGEDDGLAILTSAQWRLLVTAIRDGKL